MIYKSKKNPDKCLKNEAKYAVLKTIFFASRHLSPREIAARTGLPFGSIRNQLDRLTDMRYIWRLNERRKLKKNYYAYKYLRRKGFRTYDRLSKIDKVREALGIYLPLSFKTRITPDLEEKYRQFLKK